MTPRLITLIKLRPQRRRPEPKKVIEIKPRKKRELKKDKKVAETKFDKPKVTLNFATSKPLKPAKKAKLDKLDMSSLIVNHTFKPVQAGQDEDEFEDISAIKARQTVTHSKQDDLLSEPLSVIFTDEPPSSSLTLRLDEMHAPTDVLASKQVRQAWVPNARGNPVRIRTEEFERIGQFEQWDMLVKRDWPSNYIVMAPSDKSTDA